MARVASPDRAKPTRVAQGGPRRVGGARTALDPRELFGAVPFAITQAMQLPRIKLGVLVLVILAAACGGAGGGPSSTLDRYARALRDHDYGTAYELMSSSYRAKVSREEFVRLLRDNPREVAETAERLSAKRGSVEVSAELVYGFGDRIGLAQERGRWTIAGNPLVFYDQATPRAALRSFVRAYRLRRWDVMLRFVPEKYQQQMDGKTLQGQFEGASRDESERMMNAIEQHLEAPISEQGATARMPYGDRFEVKFVREDGLWKLQDLD